MSDFRNELAALVEALERRTNGLTGRQFDNMVSPSMANAFVNAWVALGRNPLDVPAEWQDMADTYADIG